MKALHRFLARQRIAAAETAKFGAMPGYRSPRISPYSEFS